MPSNNFELHDLTEERTSSPRETSRNTGCYVSRLKSFLLILVVILLIVGVGLLVFFVTPKGDNCSAADKTESDWTPGSAQAIEMCQKYIDGGGSTAANICSRCPTLTTQSTTTISARLTTKSIYPRDKYRLPSKVVPSHYTLRLQPHFYSGDPNSFFFEGNISIDVTCLNPTDVVTLHVYGLEILHPDVTVVVKTSNEDVPVVSVTYEKEPEFFHIRLNKTLMANQVYQIRFAHFQGVLSTSMVGLFVDSYNDETQTVYLVASHFSPLDARKAFPCFDEPALKATFDVTLVRKSVYAGRNYVTLSNMPLLRSTPNGNWTEDIYERTPIMSTYLMAFIVCDFTFNETNVRGVKYRTWSRSNAIQNSYKAHEFGLKIFENLDTRFSPNYSTVISKMDNIHVPSLSVVGMENWGLVIYDERNIMFTSNESAVTTLGDIANVLAHEQTHLWFGDLVTPKWWNFLWLKDAFATFWGFQCMQDILPAWRTVDMNVGENLYRTLKFDSSTSSHPLTADVATRTEIYQIFDGISYFKGSFIIRMIHFIMGEDKFLEATNVYLNRLKFGAAEPKDFWDALNQVQTEEHGRVNMTEKMDPWVTQMGYPVVNVTRQKGTIVISQQRFLLVSSHSVDKRYENPPYQYQWEIPITYCTSVSSCNNKTANDIHWLRKNDTLIISDDAPNASDSWVLVNIQQYGYFRVQYDVSNWKALITQLKRNHTVFHPINRGQIIDDAWNLANAGMLDMSVALGTLDYMKAETDFVAWKAFSPVIDDIARMVDNTDLQDDFNAFILDTVLIPMKTLSFTITENMAPIDVLVRVMIAERACSYGNVKCITYAKELFAKWKDTGSNEIVPELRKQYYCTAVAEGDENDWNFAYVQYSLSADQVDLYADRGDNLILLRAMACTKNIFLLRKFLLVCLDPSKNQTRCTEEALKEVTKNKEGREIAWQFFVDNYDRFGKLNKSDSMKQLFLAIAADHSNFTQLLKQLAELPDVDDIIPNDVIAEARRNWNRRYNNYSTILKEWPNNKKIHGYRLPTTLKPLHYKLVLYPHIYENNTANYYYQGSVCISFNCLNATSVITLHQKDLIIRSSMIKVSDNRTPNVSLEITHTTMGKASLYQVHLAQPLEAGMNYSLEFLDFVGLLKAGDHGLYLSSYQDENQTVYLAATQMEPTHARKVFPCFDEPGMKATFDVTLIRQKEYNNRSYITLSNMPLVSSETNGSLIKDTFQTSMLMSTYLLAFFVCDFKFLSYNFTGVQYRTYTSPIALRNAEALHNYGIEIFEWYNREFNPKYQTYLPKLDNIVAEGFGSMENWGLIRYQTDVSCTNDSDAQDLVSCVYVISHEIAHTWFGNMVSPAWWDYLWLKEGFASYWANYVVDQVHPDWKMKEITLEDEVFTIMQVDSTLKPLMNHVQSPAEIEAQYSTITYIKGGALVSMMHLIMGDHFLPALNVYLEKYALKNVDTNDLFDTLDKFSASKGLHLNMTRIMDSWLTHGGYPLVTVRRLNDSLHISQASYNAENEGFNETGNVRPYKFEIPVTFTTSREQNFTKNWTDIWWLNETHDLIIPLSPDDAAADWIVVNLQHKGYYRVQYEIKEWCALVSQLNTNHTAIDVLNRATLIDDAWSLTGKGLLPFNITLAIIDYLRNETSYGPWAAFIRAKTYMHSVLTYSERYYDFKQYMSNLVDGPLQTLGVEIPDSNIPPADSLLNILLLKEACQYENSKCVSMAFKYVLNNETVTVNSRIPDDLNKILLCTVVREGNRSVWEFIHKAWRNETEGYERFLLLNALGCSKDQDLLKTYLQNCVLGNESLEVAAKICLMSVATNSYGWKIALIFIIENVQCHRNGIFDSVVSTMAKHSPSEFLLVLKKYLGSGGEAKVRKNRKWLDTNSPIISSWLQSKTGCLGYQ